MVCWRGTRGRVGTVPGESVPRQQWGRSGYSIWRLLTLALNLFTNFFLLPLQVVLGASFVLRGTAVCGHGSHVALIFFLLGRIEVPGYAST